MSPVDTLGMRVIGIPRSLSEIVPPAPSNPPLGKPGRGGKQHHNGALKSISKLWALYRPNSLADGTGNPSMNWPDSSGHGNDAPAMASAPNQVIQRYDTGIASAYVEGNGSHEGFNIPDRNPFFTNPYQYTIYAVFRPTGSDTPFWSLSESSGDTTLRLGFQGTGEFMQDSTYAARFATNEKVALNQWHYLVYIINGQQTGRVWVDGKKFSWNGNGPPITINSPLHSHVASGWYQIFGGYPRMTGDLAELAIYDKAVSNSERLTIEQHAKFKFKL